MTSKLTRVNGVLKVDIDGAIYEPLSFTSFRPTARNISDFYKAGVKLFSILSTGLYSILGVPYSLYGESWTGPGQYDFSAIDRQIELFRENAPGCYYALMLQLGEQKNIRGHVRQILRFVGDDLGELNQLSFLAGALGLGHEALGRTSDGAGHTALTGLQHNDGNQTNSAQNLNNSENDVQNSHNSSKRQLTTVIPANGKP